MRFSPDKKKSQRKLIKLANIIVFLLRLCLPPITVCLQGQRNKTQK